MKGHPIGRSMERWWKDHSDNPDDSEWARWIDIFSELLETKKSEWLKEHENLDVNGSPVFGMAKSIGCTRANALSLLGHEGEQYSGSSRFTFWLGHVVEVAALATLNAIGYELLGAQEPCYLGTTNASTSDNIIKLLGKGTVVSVKSTAYKMSSARKVKGGGTEYNRRGFAELPFMGVKLAQPSWYVQLVTEIEAHGIVPGIVLAASKHITTA